MAVHLPIMFKGRNGFGNIAIDAPFLPDANGVKKVTLLYAYRFDVAGSPGADLIGTGAFDPVLTTSGISQVNAGDWSTWTLMGLLKIDY